MSDIYLYLVLSGVLTLFLWMPYVVARLFVWGPLTFVKNYPENFPKELPVQPLWAERAQRAHLNMVETMPAFIAVVVGTTILINDGSQGVESIAFLCAVFFWSRVLYSVVYILGIPYLRTPVYLVSWFSILAIAASVLP